jgi:hypothetical protein
MRRKVRGVIIEKNMLLVYFMFQNMQISLLIFEKNLLTILGPSDPPRPPQFGPKPKYKCFFLEASPNCVDMCTVLFSLVQSNNEKKAQSLPELSS